MNEVSVLLSAVQEAGAAILKIQKTKFLVTHKANKDILTEADLLANDILKQRLLHAFPQDGWLSEESVDDLARLNCERVWIVDPIDGTKEYAAGVPEYAVSVALVQAGEPILAAVFNPATNELFHAQKNAGAWLNHEKITSRSTLMADQKMLVLVSRSEYDRGEWNNKSDDWTIQSVGSIAYKLALIAAGKAHATISLGPKSEWDIAAGILLVTEAAGTVTNKYRHPILLNQQNVLVPGIVASAAMMQDNVHAFINLYF